MQELGLASMPPGSYSQIRLFVDDAWVEVDGSTQPLSIPSAEQSGVKLITSFEMPACGTLTLSLDWDVGAHLTLNGQGYKLRPTLKLDAPVLDDSGCSGSDGVVFVSSTATQGDMAFGGSQTTGVGVERADAGCTALAQAAELGAGPWHAWLHTSTETARARLDGGGPWFNTAGDLVAVDIDDLTDGTLANPIAYDETGTSVGSAFVYTGVNEDGVTQTTTTTCSDWTSAAPATIGGGAADQADHRWTRYWQSGCPGVQRVYCFGG